MAHKTIDYEPNELHTELPKVTSSDPEYSISLISLLMSIAGQPVVGLILGIIGLRQSKAARRSNTLALLGFIFGIIFASLWLLFVVLYIILGVFAFLAHGQSGF